MTRLRFASDTRQGLGAIGRQLGSFSAADIVYLLDDADSSVAELDVRAREARIREGRHYADVLPVEHDPSPSYLESVDAAVVGHVDQIAELVARVGERLARWPRPVVLASIARGGCPAGVLLRRYLSEVAGREVDHVGVSVIKGRGLDPAAARLLDELQFSFDVMFVDGWTGKGGIADELGGRVSRFVVLADPAGRAAIAGTRDDELIPSAYLNALSHGMISRTVGSRSPGETFDATRVVPPSPLDRSVWMADLIGSRLRPPVGSAVIGPDATTIATSRAAVGALAERCASGDRSRVRPGIGEATRVLLRRLPERLLVRDHEDPRVAPLLVRARESSVDVEAVPDLYWRAAAVLAGA